MHNRFLVSSFNREILKEIEAVREQKYGREGHPYFDIIYLYNDENKPLPDVDIYTSFGDGINISANHMTEEVVKNIKDKNKKIGVWVRACDFIENDEWYE